MTRQILGWVSLVGLCACEPLATYRAVRENVPVRTKSDAVVPDAGSPARLKVMAWNVKYGAGRIDFWFDFWGDRVEMTRAEVLTNMEGIYKLINEVNPDVLMASEIELNSRRSAYVDMVKGILENTKFNYAAYVPTWDSRYVPSEGLGRINMGNAIFSTHPIVKAESLPMRDRSDLDALTGTFYLHRKIARAVLNVGGQEVAVYGIHAEAYDTDGTKSKQLVELKALLDEEPRPFVVGGDFNAIPPGSVRVNRFNDEHPSSLGTEFEQPPYNLEDLKLYYDHYVPEIELARYGATEESQKRYYSHSVLSADKIGSNDEPGFWTRKLDYLFLKKPSVFVPGSTDVLQRPGDMGIESDPMLLSDHAPVVGTWEVAP